MKEDMIETQGPEPIDLIVLLKDCCRILRGKWIALLLVMAVFGSVLTAWRYVNYHPYYTATATYAITTYQDGSSTAYQDGSLTRQMAETAPYVLNSDMFRRRVVEALGGEFVPGNIHASVMENTNFLTISSTNADPQYAWETLKAVQTVFPDISERIIGKFYMEPMDESGVPAAPTNPRTIKADFIKGALTGLLLGFGAIALAAFTNGTVRREEDCIKRINTKCLASIPRIHQKVRSEKKEQRLNILSANPDPDLVEAFRNLRNKLERKSEKAGCRTLLITSSLPGEGKSTVAVNTALSLAQAGKRVALVDCDLRNPSDAQILSFAKNITPMQDSPLTNGPGLIDFFTGKAELADCLVEGQTIAGYPLPLRFIRGGAAVQDGSEYIRTDSMQALLRFFRSDVDYLILDTPPAGLITDAGMLAQFADGILFVVQEDFAKVDKILEAMEHVSQSGCEMLGCVLNDSH